MMVSFMQPGHCIEIAPGSLVTRDLQDEQYKAVFIGR